MTSQWLHPSFIYISFGTDWVNLIIFHESIFFVNGKATLLLRYWLDLIWKLTSTGSKLNRNELTDWSKFNLIKHLVASANYYFSTNLKSFLSFRKESKILILWLVCNFSFFLKVKLFTHTAEENKICESLKMFSIPSVAKHKKKKTKTEREGERKYLYTHVESTSHSLHYHSFIFCLLFGSLCQFSRRVTLDKWGSSVILVYLIEL